MTCVPWSFDDVALVDTWTLDNQNIEKPGISFSADGSKMFIAGAFYYGTPPTDYYVYGVREYALSTAWNISTATHTATFDASGQTSAVYGLSFKPDGTGFYVVDLLGDRVLRYSLSTAWDITSASYVSARSVSAQTTTPISVVLSTDGTKMFVGASGSTAGRIYRYTLSTAWDITTATYSSQSLSPARNPTGFGFATDGSVLFTLETITANRINRRTLSTAWSFTTTTAAGSYTLPAPYDDSISDPIALFMRPDGEAMYVIWSPEASTNDTVVVLHISLCGALAVTRRPVVGRIGFR